MFSAQDIILVLLGFISCFMGYSMFKGMLPMWGFILGGWVAMTVAPNFITVEGLEPVYLTIGFFVAGGIIGALVAAPLYYVVVFGSGAALGALVGVLLGALIDVGGVGSMNQLRSLANLSFPPQPSSLTQWVLLVILGLGLGAAAINFQKFTITASSAFIGSAALVASLGFLFTRGMNAASAGVVNMLAWLVLGLVGMFVQFRILGDEI